MGGAGLCVVAAALPFGVNAASFLVAAVLVPAAVLVSWLGLGLDLPVALCALTIGATALINVVSMLKSRENRRLTEREAVPVSPARVAVMVTAPFLLAPDGISPATRVAV